MTELKFNIVPVINPSIRFDYRDNEHIISFRDSNRHFRISGTFYDLLSIVDNRKSIEQIVIDYNNSHEECIDNETAYSLLYDKLNSSNIIVNPNGKPNDYLKPSYLKLSTVLISPHLTEVLSKPFRFLFNRHLIRIVPIACLIILSSILILKFEEVVKLLSKIPTSMLLAYTGLMMISSIFHEFGHASATFNFGGKCGSIGFGFYLFTPVLFADVSDAWKFETRKRIIVNFAGIYFELVFCTHITLLALFSGSALILILPVIIFLKTLFNLNPFFRNDGYWILSDLLRCPNLKSVSDSKLRQFLKSRVAKINRRDLVLLIYSVLNNVFIAIFLVTIILINPSSIIMFPLNLYDFIISFYKGPEEIDIAYLGRLLIPMTFYYLLIRFITTIIKKKKIIPFI